VPEASAEALVACDSSSGSAHAVDGALGLLAPRPAIAASAWETHLAAAPPALAAPGRDAARESARATQSELAAAGWPSTAEAFGTSRGTWQALVDLAELRRAAVIVTGTRAHAPIVPSLIGSVAEGVLRHAGRPVLLVPSP
jgi:nucleotide-binding universal stress UspA family protein